MLYLALEDSLARLQRRLLDITDSAPECLHFSTLASDIHSGLDEQVKAFLSAHPDTRLVAIDTLQKVRGNMVEQNNYANDYHDLAALKALADELGVAILLVHHLRKEYDADPMNMISGTTGISAATDSNFALIREKRGGRKAKLHCSGRDIEDRELEVEFDSDKHTWKLLVDSVEEPEASVDPLVLCVIELVRSLGMFQGTVSELAEMLGVTTEITPNALSRKVMRHLSVLEEHGVSYTNHRSGRRREIALTFRADDDDDANDDNQGSGPASERSSQPSLSSQEGTAST